MIFGGFSLLTPFISVNPNSHRKIKGWFTIVFKNLIHTEYFFTLIDISINILLIARILGRDSFLSASTYHNSDVFSRYFQDEALIELNDKPPFKQSHFSGVWFLLINDPWRSESNLIFFKKQCNSIARYLKAKPD